MTARTQLTGQWRHVTTASDVVSLVRADGYLLYIDTRTWWHVVVLAPGAAVALVAFERWTANDLARVALPCVIVAAAVWPLGVLLAGSPNAYWGVCAVFPRPP